MPGVIDWAAARARIEADLTLIAAAPSDAGDLIAAYVGLLRAALALSLAYALGQVLPWATHPHWLVLSVAVVLRGNLEQTLSRRNERIIGTVLGCLLVMALAQLHEPRVLGLAFLAAVGVAHAYVNKRYRAHAGLRVTGLH